MGDVRDAGFLTRFETGACHELAETAVAEWAPDQVTNIREWGVVPAAEDLGPEVDLQVRAFLVGALDDLVSLSGRLGRAFPGPEALGIAYVATRQRAGGGLDGHGWGLEGRDMHEQALFWEPVRLRVIGRPGDPDTWRFTVSA
jgi:hypothetical protein